MIMTFEKILAIYFILFISFSSFANATDAKGVSDKIKNESILKNDIKFDPYNLKTIIANQNKIFLTKEMEKNEKKLLYKKLFQSAVILFLGYLFLYLLIFLINNQVKNIKLRHLLRKSIIYTFNFLIILLVFFNWIKSVGSLTIFISILSAGLALSLQEIILSVAGWLFILARRPFEVGDRIELKGVKGDVIDIRLFQTVLLEVGNWVDADQSTGRMVTVPNSAVLKEESYNYSRGFDFIWNEIKILITFESDWKKAEEIILKHSNVEEKEIAATVSKKIKHMAKQYMISYKNFSPIVYVEIKDSGVTLTLRYLTEARARRITQDKLSRAILDEFKSEENINFAYPTYRIVK